VSPDLQPGTSAVERTLASARQKLLDARVAAGHWEGELSSSALATATAVVALDLVRRHRADAPKNLAELVRGGLTWLARNRNADGGFGDTVDSPSNISTTTLCWAALGLDPEQRTTAAGAEAWLRKECEDAVRSAAGARSGPAR